MTLGFESRAESRDRTAIQFSAPCRPTGYRTGLDGNPIRPTVSEGNVAVTCRPSYKIEQDVLTEASART